MRRPLVPLLLAPLVMVPVAACSSDDSGMMGGGPQGSDQPGATTPTTRAGELTCEWAGLFRVTYPEGWWADEDCSGFAPAGGPTAESGPVPAITVEAVTQTYEDLVEVELPEGAVREEVALGPVRAERVEYVAGSSAGGAGGSGGATPVVRYVVDLVPGTGTASTSEEQALVMSAVASAGLPLDEVTAVLDRMVESISITAYRPERGDPEPE